jgi:Mitochondrial degradasome RNA helicase subunit C terminal
MDVLKRFAAKKAAGQHSGLTKNMIPKAAKSFEDLARLCGIFSELELFLWLQRKFPPGNMMEQQAANVLRERAIQFISTGLSNVSAVESLGMSFFVSFLSSNTSIWYS